MEVAVAIALIVAGLVCMAVSSLHGSSHNGNNH